MANQARKRQQKGTAHSSVAEFYAGASEASGGFVQVSFEHACLPLMIGSDGHPIFLYKLVEFLDEYADYGELKGEFPTLSYGQIAGAMSFLRKLAQFNLYEVDIDKEEDGKLENSEEFQAIIERAIRDQETLRVLDAK
jgi:hypothetical protein